MLNCIGCGHRRYVLDGSGIVLLAVRVTDNSNTTHSVAATLQSAKKSSHARDEKVDPWTIHFNRDDRPQQQYKYK